MRLRLRPVWESSSGACRRRTLYPRPSIARGSRRHRRPPRGPRQRPGRRCRARSSPRVARTSRTSPLASVGTAKPTRSGCSTPGDSPAFGSHPSTSPLEAPDRRAASPRRCHQPQRCRWRLAATDPAESPRPAAVARAPIVAKGSKGRPGEAIPPRPAAKVKAPVPKWVDPYDSMPPLRNPFVDELLRRPHHCMPTSPDLRQKPRQRAVQCIADSATRCLSLRPGRPAGGRDARSSERLQGPTWPARSTPGTSIWPGRSGRSLRPQYVAASLTYQSLFARVWSSTF